MTDRDPARHKAYISHCMGPTRCCYAPKHRYCEIGKALWVEYRLDDIMAMPDRYSRRTAMANEKRQNPHLYPDLLERARAALGIE